MRRLGLLALALLSSCSTLVGVDDYEAVECSGSACGATDALVSGDDTALGDGTLPDAQTEDAVSDETSDAAPDTQRDAVSVDVAPKDGSAAADVLADTAVCVPVAAKLVSTGTTSIDATEVTNAQYAAFLLAKGSNVSGQPAYCAFNTSYVPSSGWPAPAGRCNQPVVHIDWCDAYAYCAWAGKRLCGHPSGGSVPHSGEAYKTISTSQWYSACSSNGIHRFPYGATYIAGACVDDAYDGKGGVATTDVTLPVGAAPLCKAATPPFAELRDMVGNVGEWEDSCNEAKDGDDDCRVRGGGYLSAWDKAACDVVENLKRKNNSADVGLRCCAP